MADEFTALIKIEGVDEAMAKLTELGYVGLNSFKQIDAAVSALNQTLEEIGQKFEGASQKVGVTHREVERGGEKFREFGEKGKEAFEGVARASEGLVSSLNNISAEGAIRTFETLTSTIKGVTDSIPLLGKAIGGALIGFSAGVAATGALTLGLLETAKAAAEEIREVNNLAAAAGLTAGEVKGLKSAFTAAGVSGEQFTTMVRFLSIRIRADLPEVIKSVRDSADLLTGDQIKITQTASALEGAADQTAKSFINVKEAALGLASAEQKVAEASINVKQADLARAAAHQNVINQRLASEQAAQGVERAEYNLYLALGNARDKDMEQALGIKDAELALEAAKHRQIEVRRQNAEAALNEQRANLAYETALREQQKVTLDLAKAQIDLREAQRQANLAGTKEQQLEIEHRQAQRKLDDDRAKSIPLLAEQLERAGKGEGKSIDDVNMRLVSTKDLFDAILLRAERRPGGATFTNMILSLSEAFKTLGNEAGAAETKTALLRQAGMRGFGQEFIKALEEGPERLMARMRLGAQDPGNKIFTEQKEAAEEFFVSMNKVQARFEHLRTEVGAAFFEPFTEGLTKLANYMKEKGGSIADFAEHANGLKETIRDIFRVLTGEQPVTPWITALKLGFDGLILTFNGLSASLQTIAGVLKEIADSYLVQLFFGKDKLVKDTKEHQQKLSEYRDEDDKIDQLRDQLKREDEERKARAEAERREKEKEESDIQANIPRGGEMAGTMAPAGKGQFFVPGVGVVDEEESAETARDPTTGRFVAGPPRPPRVRQGTARDPTTGRFIKGPPPPPPAPTTEAEPYPAEPPVEPPTVRAAPAPQPAPPPAPAPAPVPAAPAPTPEVGAPPVFTPPRAPPPAPAPAPEILPPAPAIPGTPPAPSPTPPEPAPAAIAPPPAQPPRPSPFAAAPPPAPPPEPEAPEISPGLPTRLLGAVLGRILGPVGVLLGSTERANTGEQPVEFPEVKQGPGRSQLEDSIKLLTETIEKGTAKADAGSPAAPTPTAASPARTTDEEENALVNKLLGRKAPTEQELADAKLQNDAARKQELAAQKQSEAADKHDAAARKPAARKEAEAGETKAEAPPKPGETRDERGVVTTSTDFQYTQAKGGPPIAYSGTAAETQQFIYAKQEQEQRRQAEAESQMTSVMPPAPVRPKIVYAPGVKPDEDQALSRMTPGGGKLVFAPGYKPDQDFSYTRAPDGAATISAPRPKPPVPGGVEKADRPEDTAPAVAAPGGTEKADRIEASLTEGGQKLSKSADDAGEQITGSGVKFKEDVSEATASLKSVVDQLAAKAGQTPATAPTSEGETYTTGETFAEGGHVEGAGTETSDSVPIMASKGEFVMRAAAVKHYGVHVMERLNAIRGVPHLAAGGEISIPPISFSPGVPSMTLAPTVNLQHLAGGGTVTHRIDMRTPIGDYTVSADEHTVRSMKTASTMARAVSAGVRPSSYR